MYAPPELGRSRGIRLAHVVGARPQFVKLAPMCRATAALSGPVAASIENIIIHTGQHYDTLMSTVFFEELGIPRPDIDLEIGSGSHGAQTGRMLEKLEPVLERHRPDMVITYGDTNSTLAATLVAAKLRIPMAHVEAGLRSFNRGMPEETNRIVADHLSNLLFAPTPAAMGNLAQEGLGDRSIQVGDVMLDSTRHFLTRALERSHVHETLGLTAGRYLVATVHRASTTDGPALGQLLDVFNEIARPDCPVILPVHPRTARRIAAASQWRATPALRLIEPLGYLDMIRLVTAARIVLTDSGGLQKEAFFLGRPCITLRDETEWVETVTEGGNIIAGTDPSRILSAVQTWENSLSRGDPDWSAGTTRNFGDGMAAEKIIARVIEHIEE
jgi:UDP-GlcNAc3NAcA epimerase